MICEPGEFERLMAQVNESLLWAIARIRAREKEFGVPFTALYEKNEKGQYVMTVRPVVRDAKQG